MLSHVILKLEHGKAEDGLGDDWEISLDSTQKVSMLRHWDVIDVAYCHVCRNPRSATRETGLDMTLQLSKPVAALNHDTEGAASHLPSHETANKWCFHAA